MKVKVKYKCISYNSGDKFTHKEEYEVPNYKEIVKESTLRKVTGIENIPSTYTITIEQQVDDYISELDKTDMMHRHDIMTILDWEIVLPSDKVSTTEPKLSKRHKFELALMIMVNNNNLNESMVDDIMACYERLYKNIKSLSLTKQMKITLDSLGIAYKAASTTLRYLNEYSESLRNRDIKELKELKQLKQQQMNDKTILGNQTDENDDTIADGLVDESTVITEDVKK